MGFFQKEAIRGLYRTLNKERIPVLLSLLGLILLFGAGGFALTEPMDGTWYEALGRGIWWAMVTALTVGYGDVVPVTFWGRMVGMAIMIMGVVNLSLLTATVASVFIERKFRREKGLEPIKAAQHVLMLGWPEDAQALMDQLLNRLPTTTPLTVVSRSAPEELDALRDKYAKHSLFFVWGDYSREEVLHRANVKDAVKAIILADRQAEETSAQVDQRTLLTALTLKALQPKIRILAELLRPENYAYLERAGAEDIILRGQYDNALLAGAIASTGLFRIMTNLLSSEGHTLWALEIPHRFHGRPIKELAAYLQDHHKGLLIAIYSEGRTLSLEDLLSEERSAIDDFIRRKFAETKMTHLLGRTKVEYQINPPPSQLILPHHVAVVIASQRPVL
jgi:voltage-gated potassium channel